VDVLNLYDIMNVMMEQRGIKIRRLQLPAEFAAISSYGLPFSEQNPREKPDLCGAIRPGAHQRHVACKSNPVGCLTPTGRTAATAAVGVDRETRESAAFPDDGPNRQNAGIRYADRTVLRPSRTVTGTTTIKRRLRVGEQPTGWTCRPPVPLVSARPNRATRSGFSARILFENGNP